MNKITNIIRQKVIGKKCWYVSAGGCVGSSFELLFGKRIPRDIIVKNPAHTDEFRHNTGEATILVWCCWRLDGIEKPLISSDCPTDDVVEILGRLVDSTIIDINIELPSWDTKIKFSTGDVLHIFCDHLPGDPSFDGNWEFSSPDVSYYFGPGVKVKVK